MNESWRKSSYSGGNDPNCVECRSLDGYRVDMRDTRNRRLGHLAFPVGEWAALLADVRADRL
ncbi:hypothetical protein HDA32_003513 [Spinactinospora alkalitolerans]|uniref:DUF397 domain-containing protein n=1 Tax=Spinactinospora alkalitolerans TaxID=687207 RepID=A0A852U051_9ACTN|nr:DUF397 domain-containing protein [Spinactinospora alkalitolerans]NYE48393.1 hypothetical protein [Spinactinospora alkalitolerans]